MTFEYIVDGKPSSYSGISFLESRVALVAEAGTTSPPLRFECALDLSAVGAHHFDVDRTDAVLLVFRNHGWRPRRLIRLKRRIGDDKKSVGFIFSIQALIDATVNPEWDAAVLPYVAAGIRQLVAGLGGVKPRELELRPDGDYRLSEVFPDDLQLCVISRTQWVDFDERCEVELLYQLNLLGFYVVRQAALTKQPNRNDAHGLRLEALFEHEDAPDFQIETCTAAIATEPYFKHYIEEMAVERNDPLIKFMQLYQVYEILKDHVLIDKVKEQILPGVTAGEFNGYSLRRKLSRMGTDAFLVNAMVQDYANQSAFSRAFHYSLFSWFLDEEGAPIDGEDIPQLGQYVYRLRNTLVHNLRGVYAGNAATVERRLKRLEELISALEYHIVELAVGIRLS
jgi:hypothetical protein